jgi:hypothetical protein
MHVLPSTWAFKCKSFPDGIIRKFKAIFCARGDHQIDGLDFFETFAPVVAWETIRIMLIMSIIFDLATLQVDYTAAFVHADIEKPPNYHTVHDDLFSNVHNDGTALGLLTPKFRNGLLRTGLEDNFLAEYDRAGNLIPPPPLQDEWLTGQESQVRDKARTRQHQRQTQTVPLQQLDAPAPDLVQSMQPLFPPSLAYTHSTSQLPTVPFWRE